MRLLDAQHVSDWRLCIGCGACEYICPEQRITLTNIMHDGIRPRIEGNRCTQCTDCLRVCPGIEVSHALDPQTSGLIPGLRKGWGPILEIWEGHAADPEIRINGSSGGLASALALYCIEKDGMQGVLHVGPDDTKPIANKTVFSINRSQILARTGSRYSPASPCDGLGMIERAGNPCVFIGKPCDVTALNKARKIRPALDRNVGVSIGIFCAGTPALQGTIDLLREFGVEPNSVAELRYRGRGWPGKFTVRLQGENVNRELSTYMESWGFVQKYRPYRCYLCPDGTSEFADISCGDPWYRHIKEGEQGHSLVLIRTEKGRQILHGAIQAGYITLEPVDPGILEASQKNLLTKRGAVWGRLLMMKLLGVPSPSLNGFNLFKNWMSIPALDKVRSVLGTARRIIKRNYFKPVKF